MPPYFGAAILGLVVWAVRAYIKARLASPGISGPTVPSFVFGHALDVAQAPIGTRYNEWEKQYGLTYQLKGPFGKNTLIVNDPKGMNHVLQGRNYQRNSGDTELIKMCFGHGLFSAEGEEHRMMRKNVSGALSNQAVQEVSHVFFELAERLVRSWEQKLDGNESGIFDITPDIHRLTLDAISMTMFAHDLSGGEIPTILKRITHSPPDGPADVLLKTFASQFPVIMNLPSPMKKWCTELRTSLGAVAKEVWSGHEAAGMHAKLLTTLAKENVPEDITIANIIGVIFAGSETTANVIIESFYELARNQDMQKRIRAELAAFEAANGRRPTYEDLINPVHLPYFDAYTKEVLRTKSVLVTISRTAVRDDVIPLQIPAKSASDFKDVYEIPVKAGTLVEIPIRDGINVSEAIWGPDAAVFDPERWLNPDRLPESVKWVHAQGNMLTFGDGQKVCLGRSFALAEFKAALASLVRVFAFEEVPGVKFDFYHVGGNTVKPMIHGRENEGTQMPLKYHLLETRHLLFSPLMYYKQRQAPEKLPRDESTTQCHTAKRYQSYLDAEELLASIPRDKDPVLTHPNAPMSWRAPAEVNKEASHSFSPAMLSSTSGMAASYTPHASSIGHLRSEDEFMNNTGTTTGTDLDHVMESISSTSQELKQAILSADRVSVPYERPFPCSIPHIVLPAYRMDPLSSMSVPQTPSQMPMQHVFSQPNDSESIMLKLQHLMDLNTHIRAMLEYLSGSLQSPPTIPGDQSLPKPSHAVDEKFGEVAYSYLSDASPSSSFGVASHVGDATDPFQNPCNRGLKDYELDVKRIEDGLDKRTTVMVKNIPNKVTGKELQIFIDEACGRRIDFMYLRIDYRTRANYGYAFVNFLTCQDLLRFVRAKMNRKWNLHSSEKVVQVNYARLQGKKALIRHFYDSNVLDEREEWRPKLFYSDGLHQGLPEPFPSLRNVIKSQSSAFAENAQELRREANRVERSRNKRARLA